MSCPKYKLSMKNKNMKKIYIHKIHLILCFTSVLCFGLPINAQQNAKNGAADNNKKAWEIGIGATGLQMTRFNVINFHTNNKGGYTVGTNKKDFIFGGNLYFARELNSHFYLDLQGTLDYSSDPVRNGKESRWLGMAGIGLQWRLGEYLHSNYIDPFLRMGANYMYKNFKINYKGMEEFNSEEMGWNLSNDYTKEGKDKQNLIPISLGIGVNMWLNDNIGIGLQGDYLIMPYKHIANSWQGSIRLMWRIGGKFDKTEITPKAATIIDEIAQIMLTDTSKKYLITGCTDAKGSSQYNMDLSQKRADAVVNALIKKGVPNKMLKAKGVGAKISYASQNAPNEIREGDRKIIVQIITNMDYWNYIP